VTRRPGFAQKGAHSDATDNDQTGNNVLVPVLLVAALLIPATSTLAQPAPAAATSSPKMKVTTAAFDASPAMRDSVSQ
jgi:hypothetical protein